MKNSLIVWLSLLSLFLLIGCNNSEGAEYKSNLQSVADEIVDNASGVDEMLDVYSAVWSHSIKSRGAIPIDEMVVVTGFDRQDVETHFIVNNAGNVTDDFSVNIHSVNSYYEDTGKLDEIRENSNDIKDKMSELNDPSSDFEQVYEELLDMYNYSEEFNEMALDPSGSSQSFNDDKNQLLKDINSKYKRIEVIIPNNK